MNSSTKQVLVIGDIHGCLDQLKQLIALAPKGTQVYSVGDIIDRGPNSRGVIDLVRSTGIQAVRGNHEEMATECLPSIREYILTPTTSLMYKLGGTDWFMNGGHDVFNQYSATNDLPQLVVDMEYLQALPLYIETGVVDSDGLELLVSHTWESHKIAHASSMTFDFVWSRNQPYAKRNSTKYYNAFGHTPVDYVHKKLYHKSGATEVHPMPSFYPVGVNLDTGAPYTTKSRGVLSGMLFPSLDILQINQLGKEDCSYD